MRESGERPVDPVAEVSRLPEHMPFVGIYYETVWGRRDA
jgi:hypothetical protein